MHRFVFEDGKHRFPAIEQRIARAIELIMCQTCDNLAIGLSGEITNDLTGWPAIVHRRSASCSVRIDASREQALEAVVDRRTSKRPLHERVETEGRQMAFVE